MHTVVASCKI